MFFFLPYLIDIPMRRLPLANWVLILLTCLISVAMFPALNRWENRASFGVVLSHGHLEGQYLGDTPGHIIDDFILEPGHFRFTQLVGCLFIHAGWAHLLGNMLFLWLFGNAINARLGHWQFLSLYFASGIISNICSLLLGPSIASLGASGAIMGIMGACLILYPLNDVRCLYVFIIKLGRVEISSYWLLIIYFLLDIFGILTGGSGIDHIAHISGFLFGAAVLWLLVARDMLPPDGNEENILQKLGLKALPESAPRGRHDPL